MKLKYIIILFPISFLNCSDSKEEHFLNNFKVESEYRNDLLHGKTKAINDTDLYILNKTEAINEFEFDIDKSYSYGYKTKINNDCYLLSYNLSYKLKYNQPFTMDYGRREYWCIYQKGIGIVSKIKYSANDPIEISHEYKNGVLTTISNIIVYRYKETKEGNNIISPEKNSLISKYAIKNNRFVKLN
ncbi:MAG: hypothetical protein ABI554_04850 [Flavobacterium sp.]